MPLFSDAFWQQEIPQSKFPQWFVQRKVAVACSFSCSIILIAIGGILIALMQSYWEASIEWTNTTQVYQPGHTEAVKIEHDSKDDENVFVYVEMSNAYTNYRAFQSSKDDDIAGVPFSPFECTGGENLTDLVFIRGDHFFFDPPTDYVNEDGFFDLNNPVTDPTTIITGDFIRYKEATPAPAANNPWKKYIVVASIGDKKDPPANPIHGYITQEAAKQLSGKHIIQKQVMRPKPCGLNSFSTWFDSFELCEINDKTCADPILFDEHNTAWDTDLAFVKMKAEQKITEDPTEEEGGAGGNWGKGRKDKLRIEGLTFDDTVKTLSANKVIKFGGQTSWIKGWTQDTTHYPGENAEYQKDRSFQRLLSWYRNFAGPHFRLLIGRFKGLKKGDYFVKVKYAGKEWQDWKIDQKIVFAHLSPVGSRNYFIPILCIVVGVVQLSFAAFLLLYKKSKKT